MKFIHIADLHLGKSLHGFNLNDDQDFILSQIANIAQENHVDAVVIAGDVFDKGVASVEAIRLLRKFLNNLVQNKIKVFLISGNHDSAERLTFGAEFMSDKGIYFSKIYDGIIEPVTLNDEHGKIYFYLLPFIKPVIVKQIFAEEKIESYEDAVRCAVAHMNINTDERNVMIAHQNIMNAEHCESEETVIGGLDAVSAACFEAFDYTALGHLHKCQEVGKNIWYSGTPLKYSISELNHEKTLQLVELNEKGKIAINKIQLKPKRDIRQIRGKLEQIIKMSKDDPNNPEDFIDIILTDEHEVVDAIYTLRSFYPNIIQMSYDNATTQNQAQFDEIDVSKKISPLEIFDEFYENYAGSPMSDNQRDYMKSLIESIWEGEK